MESAGEPSKTRDSCSVDSEFNSGGSLLSLGAENSHLPGSCGGAARHTGVRTATSLLRVSWAAIAGSPDSARLSCEDKAPRGVLLVVPGRRQQLWASCTSKSGGRKHHLFVKSSFFLFSLFFTDPRQHSLVSLARIISLARV